MSGFGLVVASNRGPFTLETAPDGSVEARAAAGGLAPSLAGALAEPGTVPDTGALWVAAALTEADRSEAAAGPKAVATGQEGLSLSTVSLAPEIYQAAYDVIANGTLWFLFHGLFDRARRPRIDRVWREAWDGFRAYNEAFAEAVAAQAAPGATVVVNDYHLVLVGNRLAELRPDLETAYFSHTPFCLPGDLAMLPDDAADELLESMAAFGACGFHTARWEDEFRRCCSAAGLEAPHTFVAPLGADAARLDEVVASQPCRERLAALEERLDGRKLLLRSDRVELSKNLIRGFLAFDELLAAAPEWRGGVVFVARVYSSRESLSEYLAYRTEVEHVAERVNERWGTAGHAPVVLDVDDDFPATVAALTRSDVLLVNPIRDGLNLVAKEGPAVNSHDGVLVLSREAGAYEELADAAIGLNPFDISGTAAALATGLEMPAAERKARATQLRHLVRSRTPADWLREVRAAARTPRRSG